MRMRKPNMISVFIELEAYITLSTICNITKIDTTVLTKLERGPAPILLPLANGLSQSGG